MCVQMQKTITDPARMKFETNEFYLKDEAEMRALFPEYPEAADNTAKIADMCGYDFEFGKYKLPRFKLPEGESDSFDYLQKLCRAGLARRYPNDDGTVAKQLDYELAMIKRWALSITSSSFPTSSPTRKAKKIPVGPGRGSAAGSVVSYTLNITDVDPIKYSLYFERFLNPERVSMPDIDIDFCVNRRGEVIDYVNRKYGHDHVAQIVTFGTMAARAARARRCARARHKLRRRRRRCKGHTHGAEHDHKGRAARIKATARHVRGRRDAAPAHRRCRSARGHAAPREHARSRRRNNR